MCIECLPVLVSEDNRRCESVLCGKHMFEGMCPGVAGRFDDSGPTNCRIYWRIDRPGVHVDSHISEAKE